MSLGLDLRVVGTALETALDGSVDRTADGVTTLICVTRSIECPWARCMTESLKSTFYLSLRFKNPVYYVVLG